MSCLIATSWQEETKEADSSHHMLGPRLMCVGFGLNSWTAVHQVSKTSGELFQQTTSVQTVKLGMLAGVGIRVDAQEEEQGLR